MVEAGGRVTNMDGPAWISRRAKSSRQWQAASRYARDDRESLAGGGWRHAEGRAAP